MKELGRISEWGWSGPGYGRMKSTTHMSAREPSETSENRIYLLKSRMKNIINNAFKHKNGATRYTHIKVGRNKSYFTSDPLNGDNKYTANDICKMIEFLVDNIYVRFGGQLFRQMVGIPMGTNCAHYWMTCFSIPTKMSFWINS